MFPLDGCLAVKASVSIFTYKLNHFHRIFCLIIFRYRSVAAVFSHIYLWLFIFRKAFFKKMNTNISPTIVAFSHNSVTESQNSRISNNFSREFS